MSRWRFFQRADDDGGLGFGGQQSPHRSEVFWEGLFLVLNARPPMGADGHRFFLDSPSPLLLCLFSVPSVFRVSPLVPPPIAIDRHNGTPSIALENHPLPFFEPFA
ncbi:hypothetical protein KPH14_004727 [Odynerus spinipes]|uniref:Uncharacterized protein n=1 Tax=Odynerus spinipes TaxID=1348599 RepID=A0AAD9VPY8_9HYME|nr:hypothetical protein KPH14_004727 [Odynerus spinipes]